MGSIKGKQENCVKWTKFISMFDAGKISTCQLTETQF